MFSSESAIWKFAYAGDELDDWLPFAEDLIEKWSSQSEKEIEFRDTFEIILAAYLLKDDLLPASARMAFAELLLKTIDEVGSKKLLLEGLHIYPPKPGRKEDRHDQFIRFHEVKTLIQAGKAATEAYKEVAKKHSKSPDTIRRAYERIIKKKGKRKGGGKNNK